jgi:hypothetical protein
MKNLAIVLTLILTISCRTEIEYLEENIPLEAESEDIAEVADCCRLCGDYEYPCGDYCILEGVSCPIDNYVRGCGCTCYIDGTRPECTTSGYVSYM